VADDQVYLKQNVLAEPLFNQWYAWSHLISPANAAMYINNVHLKIMQSFVAAPQVHASAYKNPEMIGGPFMNYDASRVQEVKALLDKTIKGQERLIAFAQALQGFEKSFVDESDGISLESMYKQVPDEMRGYVELVYDLNNQPSIRFIEGLLYRSPYYNPASQSIALSLVEKDERPFVLSTPRLEDDKHAHVRLPFEHEGLDELFEMKFTPKPYERIKDILQIREEDDALFSTFFTREPSQTAPGFDGEGVRVRYFGHACLLIESKNVTILTDPVISYKIDSEIRRFTYADLPDRIDYAVITHNHQDHCMFESLLQLRHKIKTLIVPRTGGGALADPSLKLALQKIGFKNVVELDEMESIEIPGGSITGLPFLGEHADLNIRAKLGYLINLEKRSIVAVADSNNIEPRLYDYIHELIRDVDLFFIGMECDGAPMSWIYGALLTRPMPRKFDQSRRLNGSNFEKGRDILNKFNPKQAYIYAMGQEPWLTHIVAIKYTEQSVPIVESNHLVQWCRERGMESERLFGYKEILLNSN